MNQLSESICIFSLVPIKVPMIRHKFPLTGSCVHLYSSTCFWFSAPRSSRFQVPMLHCSSVSGSGVVVSFASVLSIFPSPHYTCNQLSVQTTHSTTMSANHGSCATAALSKHTGPGQSRGVRPGPRLGHINQGRRQERMPDVFLFD